MFSMVNFIYPFFSNFVCQDPKEKAKSETRDWLNNVVCIKLVFVLVVIFLCLKIFRIKVSYNPLVPCY